jgi:hypothetical protein
MILPQEANALSCAGPLELSFHEFQQPSFGAVNVGQFLRHFDFDFQLGGQGRE